MLNYVQNRTALIALACMLCADASADAAKKIDVPAGQLTSALKKLAEQSGVEFVYSTDQLEGLWTQGVQGEFTADKAVRKLLEGTNLRLAVHDSGAILIMVPDSGGPSAGVPEASRRDSQLALEEIVVTAQRRRESLRDVPISISVYSGERIENHRIETLQDYMELTPNVSFRNAGTPTSTDLGIRGISNIGGASNVFGVYVDEFNVAPGAANTTFDQRLVDLERLEVLRGPQGTFFGRNVSGGAINITTRKPQPAFEALALAEVGNHDSYVLRGSVNLPLVEQRLFARVTGYGESYGGFLKNDGVSNATNDRESYGGRLALRYLPTERLTADLSLSLSRLEQGFPNFVPSGTLDDLFVLFGFPPFPMAAGYYPDNLDHIETNQDRRTAADTLIATGRLEYQAQGFSLTSITGFIDSETDEAGDGDGTALTFWFDDQFNDFHSWSTELRAQSDREGAWQWMFGGIYARDEIEFFGIRTLGPEWFSAILGLPPDFPVPPRVSPGNDLETQDITSYGVFGELSWSGLNERLKLSLSARWQRDEIDQTTFSPRHSAFPPFELTIDDFAGSASFTNVMPRLAATYKFTDELTGYAVASKGVKPGGYNLGTEEVPGSPTTFNEEELWNYEVGLKGELLNDRLRFSLAAFHMDWDEIQVGQFFIDHETLSGVDLTINGTSARSTGVEVELAAAPTDRLEISAAVGYNDATFDDFPDAIVSLIGEVADVTGNRLPLSTEWTANAAVEYRYPLAAGALFARAEYIYRGDTYQDLDNRDIEGDLIPSYDMVNLRLGLQSKRYTVIAFVDNATDDDYVSGWVEGALTGYMAVVNPRTLGVRVIARFD